MTTDTTEPRPYLVFVAPGDVIIDTNVREIPQLNPSFVDDIRDRGVESPPIGYLDGDDRVHVLIGQRRTLAAQQVELPELAVLIKPREQVESEAAVEKSRIIRQVAENEHREQLTTAEQYSAQATLFDLGMSADEVAKALHVKRDRVRLAHKLRKEAPATVADLQEHHQVTLDQLAAISEFEEHEDLRADLYEVAETDPAQLAHRIAEARDEVTKRAQLTDAIAELEAAGIQYIADEEFPDSYEWGQFAPLDEVYLRDVPSHEEISVETAAEQGGLVASLYWAQDWERIEGSWERVAKWRPSYFIENPREHGWLDADEIGDLEEADAEHEPSPEEIERERLAVEAREREAARRRAWELADAVRQAWIRDDLLNDRKKLPSGVGMVILDGWMRGGGVLPRHSIYPGSAQLGAELLGVTGDPAKLTNFGGWVSAEEIARFEILRDRARGVGHERVLLALTLAQVEQHLQRHRENELDLARYLVLLESWGYGLSEIEAEFVQQHTAGREESTAEASEE